MWKPFHCRGQSEPLYDGDKGDDDDNDIDGDGVTI